MGVRKTLVQALSCFIPNSEARKRFRQKHQHGATTAISPELDVSERFRTVFGILEQGEISFEQYFLSNNMSEKLTAMKRGLDSASLSLLDVLLHRIFVYPTNSESDNFQIKESHYLSLHAPENHRRIQQFHTEYKSYMDNFDLMDSGYNPETFLFHHGLRYASSGIKDYIKNRDFIDAGAYIGDSALVMARYYRPRHIFSFEISPNSCKKYVTIMRKNGIPDEKYTIERLGVTDRKDQLMFNGDRDQGTSLTLVGSDQVYTTDIDSYVKENHLDVSFLKADLEGYGFKGLLGMADTIRKFRPVLSLSIYHSAEEFFEMKPLLDEITKNLDYTVELKQLRPYPDSILEATLFAYPREAGAREDDVMLARRPPRVSVVVPVYNVEKYLRQCVDSILGQTLQDIEVILVDDGSTDGSGTIIDEYSKQDGRVVVLHQENMGYGGAVNRGIEEATGEYIGIIESDDWIEATMFEKLYKNAIKNDSDIVKCHFYQHDSTAPGGPVDIKWQQDIMAAPNTAFSILDYPELYHQHVSVWAALYRSSFIKQQRMIETSGASYQDLPFMTEAICRAKRISAVKEYLVHYRKESGQVSSTLRRDKHLLYMPEQVLRAREIFKRYGLFNLLKEEYYFQAFCATHWFFLSIYFKHKRQFFMRMRELFMPIRDEPDFTFKYFSPWQREFVQKVIDNRFLSTVFPELNMKTIRKFLLSGHLKSRYARLQLLGVAFSIGTSPPQYPCLMEFSIRLGKR